MPVTKTAKRALKVSTKKASVNAKIRTAVEIALKDARKKPTESSVKKFFSIVDRAVKKELIHKNRAARLKSATSKLLKK